MGKAIITRLAALMVAALVAIPVLHGAPRSNQPKPLEEQVRHKLASLPYISPFDELSYRVDGNTVSLFGEVTEPHVKSDAEHAVKRIEGVIQVNNQIEVLPLSPMDRQIRIRTLQALFQDPSLQRYAIGVVPSIHILVKNGDVTLTGFVANQTDKNLAYLRANSVPGVFAVTNNLRVGS